MKKREDSIISTNCSEARYLAYYWYHKVHLLLKTNFEEKARFENKQSKKMLILQVHFEKILLAGRGRGPQPFGMKITTAYFCQNFQDLDQIPNSI